MQDVDGIINFGMKIDDSANVIHIILSKDILQGLRKSLVIQQLFQKTFSTKFVQQQNIYYLDE